MRREKGKPRHSMFVGSQPVREPLRASVCINCVITVTGMTVTRTNKSANIGADANGTLYTLC